MKPMNDILNRSILRNGERFHIPQTKRMYDVLINSLLNQWLDYFVELNRMVGKDENIMQEYGIVDDIVYDININNVCIKLLHGSYYYDLMSVNHKEHTLYMLKTLYIRPVSIKDVELIV